MKNLEKYLDRVIEQKPAYLPLPPAAGSEPTSNLLIGVLRRWYIAAATFLLVCAIGLPAIWLLIKPLYSVTGAIRVAPILTNILSGETDSGEISNYQNFVNTQAQMITGGQVMERVANDLIDKKLSFFEDQTTGLVRKLKRTLNAITAKAEPVSILKQAILDGVITAASDRRTELINITMKSHDPKEAEQIVNAFVRNYMAVEGSSSAQGEDQKQKLLEDEQKLLEKKLQDRRATINQLAQEYGTTTLAGRHDMKLQRVASLLAELTKMEARRIYLEAQVKVLEKTKEEAIAPQELLKIREEYINDDPSVKLLTTSIVQLDQELIAAAQTFAPTNPELNRRKELLEAMRVRLVEQRENAGKSFDELMSKEVSKTGSQKLLNAQAELEQTKAYENRFREILAKEDTETIGLGRKQLNIQDLQDQLNLTRQLYDTVSRRIQELEMERKRPARISKYSDAEIAEIRDKRIKYTIALIFGAAACGMMLAFLRDRADRSLHTPADVVRCIGIPIIGTTTSSQTIKAALLPGQIAEDYQTIRANLGLLNSDGMPKKIVITSPGMQEGKTTFAINLATSMAKSGKRVLLIDGDLRKPDIAYLLNLPHGSRGLQDILLGKEFDQAVWSISSTGLDVLPSDSRNAADAFELLASPLTAQQINMLSKRYDHLIIDTPPALAFPDALVWAKFADAVILTSFADQTTAEDLREATERFRQINVRVLGTVLSNVRAGRGYYHYGYNYYYSQDTHPKKDRRQAGTKVLISLQNPQDNNPQDNNPQDNAGKSGNPEKK